MAYDYTQERPKLFTEKGQVDFLKVRDAAKELLLIAGAWFMIACVDRLVELKEIVEIRRDCWTQYKVYSSPEVHNL